MARQLSSLAAARVLLNTAKSRFVDGEPLPSNLLPAAVARSWERSRACGLKPSHAPVYEGGGVVARGAWESRADRQLYRCVSDEIEQLWNAFGGIEWTIFCVNTAGRVIHARRSPYCEDTRLTPIVAGTQVTESHIGTTAPSCVIHDGAETIVDGSQHYLEDFAQIFCLAVPLYGIDGEIVGALDITGTGRRNVVQLREQFRYASLSAEQRLFSSVRDCHLLHLQHDPRWFGTPLSGLVAVEESGRVRAATRRARQMLGIGQAMPLSTSLHVRELFPEATPAQERRLLQPQRNAQRIARADGSHIWVQYARAPVDSSVTRRSQSPTVVAAPLRTTAVTASSHDGMHDGAGLRERELYAILRVLDEHRGNVAATARQLGVSRTTVYAKLRQLKQAGMAAPDWMSKT
ncbi:phytochrome sensor protein [Burkholderia multivorans]|uniref:helix-turn-helix domain-containing protein n=3 Tax=Burkholderia multivorans TaxID=87883 RepID=UPI001991F901|nr:helix-turn-helix domain-containing protein [Burkholderia multivorans]CAB5283025.1 phytochrome sensor protein [Burkholderia multivorans]CAB5288767.1 phytochrome sensor protein [Burkholderia multivorans]CAB5304552.1 phytochrome sensor protein [Burkholderia multivorans]CAB5306275.1 phytochrome sensor protein [Burkholderia multivorans]CAB5316216.1 phytochrome sensor protein [Burkholderia multivorans]